MLRTEKIDTIAGLATLESAWNELNRACAAESIYFSFDWFASWWKAFGAKKRLFVLVVKDDDRIVGIAPLMAVDVRQYGINRTILEVIGWPDAGCYGLVGPEKETVARELLRYLAEHRKEWSRVELHLFRWAASSGIALRKLLRETSSHSRLREQEIPIFRDYLPPAPGAADPMSSEMAAARDAFAPTSPLVIDLLSEPREIESNMPVLFQLHLNSRRESTAQSRFADSSQRRFLNDLVKRLTPSGRVNMVRMKSGDIPVAYGFNISGGNRIELHEVAVNPLFTRRSANKLFILMETAMFSGQGLKVGYSERLPSSGGFPARETGVAYDVAIYRYYSDYILSSILSALGLNLVKRKLDSEAIRTLRGKVGLTFHREGMKSLLNHALSKIFHFFGGLSATYYIYRYDGGAPKMTHLKIDIEIKKFGLGDLDRIATFYGIGTDDQKIATLKHRFGENADCYVALHHGFVVSMIWGQFHEDHYREHGVSLKPACDEVVISDALTSPIYRSMGIAPYLLGTMLADYSSRGLKAIAGVHKNNTPSRRGLEAYNFKHVRTDRVFRIFGIRII